jgi:hypothetical protein
VNLDKYFDKIYDESEYNCAHFVCEVWKDLFNQDISGPLNGVLRAPGQRRLSAHDLAVFEPVGTPTGPCLALFQIWRKQPHVGIWINGKVLHITEKGVEWTYVETFSVSFNQVRFYNVKKDYNL